MVFLWVLSLIVTIGSFVAMLFCLFEAGEGYSEYDTWHLIALALWFAVLGAFAIQCMVWIYNGAGWDWS